MFKQEIRGVPQGARLYFVGIGGISMSGLAEISLNNGFFVCGSDNHASSHVEHLKDLGIPVFIGHAAEHIDALKPEYVIYTAAVPKNNVELLRARELGIIVAERAEFLGWLTESFRSVINIAGTHGKTTTTAMASLLLIASQADPTVHLGAEFKDFNHSTVRLGEAGKLLVSEACEFNNSFLHFSSSTAVILNIDSDHLEFFNNIDNVIASFAEFSNRLEESSYLVLPFRAANIPQLLDYLCQLRRLNGKNLPRLIWFGLETDLDRPYEEDLEKEIAALLPDRPDFLAKNIQFHNGMPAFDLLMPKGEELHIQLSVPGLHNVKDALAAVAAAYFNGLRLDVAAEVLFEFSGAEGRFTVNGTYHGAMVVSDYAHHPNAARATLAAAANIPHNKTWVVFQPLTFSRVKLLFDDFVACLSDYNPDFVIFYEIFSDREFDDLGMSSRLLSDAYKNTGRLSCFAKTYEEVLQTLDEKVQTDDMLLFLGPEEVRALGQRLVREHGILKPGRK